MGKKVSVEKHRCVRCVYDTCLSAERMAAFFADESNVATETVETKKGPRDLCPRHAAHARLEERVA